MLKVAATTLDQFRKLLSDNSYSEDKLLSYITEKPTDDKFLFIGRAFHEILESPSKSYQRFIEKYPDVNEVDFLSREGVILPWNTMSKAIDLIDYKFPFEVKTTKDYSINGQSIQVVSKVDQLKGLQISEFKTSWSYFGEKGWKSFVDEYQKSIQWKLYLDAFECNEVQYYVFMLEEIDMQITLQDIIDFKFYNYDNLNRDINYLLEQFLDYIQLRKLENYFIKN